MRPATLLALLPILALPACAGRPEPPGMMMGRPPLSLAGEPLGRPARDKDAYVETTLGWFARADLDRDGRLSTAELDADVARFFATLDGDADGAVNSRELSDSRLRLAASLRSARPDGAPPPDGPRPGARPDGPRGMPMPAGLGADPVMSADLDLDFRVTLAELQAQARRTLAAADRDKDGSLSAAEAEATAETAFDRPPAGMRPRRGPPGGGPPPGGGRPGGGGGPPGGM